MKITNFLALGICLFVWFMYNAEIYYYKSTTKGTEWGWNKGTIVVKTPRTTCRTRECHRAGSSLRWK